MLKKAVNTECCPAVAWIRIPLEQNTGAEDLAALTVTALRHVLIIPRPLHRMITGRVETFDRGDLHARHTDRRHHAGTHRYVVDQDREATDLIHATNNISVLHCHGKLRDLLEMIGDIGADALEPIVNAARHIGNGAEERLWFRHSELEVLTEWRRDTAAKLVLGARLKAGESQERLANQLRERGIDALSLSHREWSGGLVTLLHRFDRYTLATDLVHEREMAKLLDIGIDAISSAHVDRMIAVSAQFT